MVTMNAFQAREFNTHLEYQYLNVFQYYAGSTNLVETGFYDAGQLRPGSKFMSLEDYCKQPLNDKRAILFVNLKPE